MYELVDVSYSAVCAATSRVLYSIKSITKPKDHCNGLYYKTTMMASCSSKPAANSCTIISLECSRGEQTEYSQTGSHVHMGTCSVLHEIPMQALKTTPATTLPEVAYKPMEQQQTRATLYYSSTSIYSGHSNKMHQSTTHVYDHGKVSFSPYTSWTHPAPTETAAQFAPRLSTH